MMVTMTLRVVSKTTTDVECIVVNGGILKEHKGMNLPGIKLSTPSLTEKDIEDLKFGLAHDVDYVALSFVRSANDIRHLRSSYSTTDKDKDSNCRED